MGNYIKYTTIGSGKSPESSNNSSLHFPRLADTSNEYRGLYKFGNFKIKLNACIYNRSSTILLTFDNETYIDPVNEKIYKILQTKDSTDTRIDLSVGSNTLYSGGYYSSDDYNVAKISYSLTVESDKFVLRFSVYAYGEEYDQASSYLIIPKDDLLIQDYQFVIRE